MTERLADLREGRWPYTGSRILAACRPPQREGAGAGKSPRRPSRRLLEGDGLPPVGSVVPLDGRLRSPQVP